MTETFKVSLRDLFFGDRPKPRSEPIPERRDGITFQSFERDDDGNLVPSKRHPALYYEECAAREAPGSPARAEFEALARAAREVHEREKTEALDRWKDS